MDGNVLKRSEVAAALRNTQKHAHTVVAPQKTFDERKVAAFRKFCTDFFDEANAPKDPLELARHGADKLKGKLDELKATVSGSKYPFVAQLSGPDRVCSNRRSASRDDWYLTEFDLGDDLLDAKESVIDPIQSFLNGAQRTIYDEAADTARHQQQQPQLPAGRQRRGRPECDSRTRMPSAATAWPSSSRPPTQLRAQIDEVVTANRATVTAAIEGRKAELVASDSTRRRRRKPSRASSQRVDQTLSRVQAREPDRPHPADRNRLRGQRVPVAARSARRLAQQGGGAPPPKQTVSIKTVAVPGASRRPRNRR